MTLRDLFKSKKPEDRDIKKACWLGGYKPEPYKDKPVGGERPEMEKE